MTSHFVDSHTGSQSTPTKPKAARAQSIYRRPAGREGSRGNVFHWIWIWAARALDRSRRQAIENHIRVLPDANYQAFERCLALAENMAKLERERATGRGITSANAN